MTAGRLPRTLRRAAHQPDVSVPLRPRHRTCWCGRPAVPGELDCAEHDDPPSRFPLLVTVTAPDTERLLDAADDLADHAAAVGVHSDPLTPGGVFDRLYP